MSYVRLVKIAAIEHPVVPPGDPETYGYGLPRADAIKDVCCDGRVQVGPV